MELTINDSRESTPMSREEVVETLKTMVFGAQAFKRFNSKERESLDYAISSLKTDEAYQLMYEGEDVYTKNEVIVMLMGLEGEIDEVSWNIEWPDGSDETIVEMDSVDNIINQKIDKLKETK